MSERDDLLLEVVEQWFQPEYRSLAEIVAANLAPAVAAMCDKAAQEARQQALKEVSERSFLVGARYGREQAQEGR